LSFRAEMFWYVVVALLAVVVYQLMKDRRYDSIPGPPGLPVLGRVPFIYYHIYKGDFLDRLLEIAEQYGKAFQVRFLGPRDRMVYITDLSDLKHFFLSPNFEKGPITHAVFEDMLGNGIFNADGATWRVQRQTASSLFHFNNLQSFVPIFAERAGVLKSILSEHATSGKPIDLQQLFMKFTLDSIGELGFGVNIDSLRGNDKALKFAQSFDYVQAKTTLRFPIHPLWKWLPQGTYNGHMKNVNDFMKNFVRDRRAEMEKGVDFSERTDLLSRFISAKDTDGKPMFDDQYLLDVLKNFLIAGRDTTAICLTWTFYLLALHPEVEKKMLQEIETVVGDDLSYEKLNRLKYMRQVIDESLRLYPPVPLNFRCTIKDDELPSGYKLPAGTRVVYPAYAIHRLSEYWTDPLAFNPDRWETDTIKAFQFVAFHGGPRICLGQNMAYEEIKVALCTLLPQFKFKLVDPSSVRYYVSVTLPTWNGVNVYVTPRNGKEE